MIRVLTAPRAHKLTRTPSQHSTGSSQKGTRLTTRDGEDGTFLFRAAYVSISQYVAYDVTLPTQTCASGYEYFSVNIMMLLCNVQVYILDCVME